LFNSRAGFEESRAAGAWRVQVTDRGEGVLLEPWREHLDVLAIRAIWCGIDRVSSLVEQVMDIAARQGYGHVLSPLVTVGVAHAYTRAGMRLHETLVLLKHGGAPLAGGSLAPPEVSLRPAVASDLSEIADVDSECFAEFWRYGPARLSRYLEEEHIIVAHAARGLLGYSLALIMRNSGTLGRLAVRPAARRQGVGEALARDTLAYLQRAEVATVSLCTQEENLASRALYRKLGMTEMSDRLVFLIGPTGCASGQG
jgi:ribosomal-protein-alanine N-acetyltransferase